jgi:type IV pilus assembly protein PilY1
MDVFDGAAWRTILVGGLGAGGRGYYALDITAPAAPRALWEFCHDSALCATSDQDLGLTYATPVITKRASDGRWVVLVTSGYNNVNPGTGRGYLYVLDAVTGNLLQKIDNGYGDTTSPSGLGKISAWADSFSFDPTSKYVYGADLTGMVYRFDLTISPGTVRRLAQLTDGGGRPQPVTTRPELASIEGYRVLFIGTGRYLGLSDLQDPDALTPPSGDAYQQSVYAFKDKATDYGDIRSGATLVAQAIKVIDSTMRSTTANAVSWSTQDGWYVDLNPGNQSPGERVTVDPQLVLGTLLVVTNVPRDDACSTGGESWLYQFNYSTGSYVSTAPFNTVANKLTNAIAVGAVVFRLSNGQLKTIVTDATGTKTPAGVNTGGTPASGKRTSWRELIR